MAVLSYLILTVIMVAIGVLLIVFSRKRGPVYPSCGRCGYDVSGSVGAVTRCPECGCEFTQVGIMPPRRRKRNPLLVAAGVILIVLPLGCFGSSLLLARAQSVRATAAQKAAQTAQQPAAPQEPAKEELTRESKIRRGGTQRTQSGAEEE